MASTDVGYGAIGDAQELTFPLSAAFCWSGRGFVGDNGRKDKAGSTALRQCWIRFLRLMSNLRRTRADNGSVVNDRRWRKADLPPAILAVSVFGHKYTDSPMR
jgi:hypothetical protein